MDGWVIEEVQSWKEKKNELHSGDINMSFKSEDIKSCQFEAI